MSTRDLQSGATRLTAWQGESGEVRFEAETSDVGTVVSGVRDSVDGESATTDAALNDYLKTSRRIYERIERAMRFVRDQPGHGDHWQEDTLERIRRLHLAARSKRSSHE